MKTLCQLTTALALLALVGTASARDHVINGTVASAEQEVATTTSDGSATVKAIFAKDMSSVRVLIRIRKLTNPDTEVTAIHFHCAPAGENGGVVFGVMGGTNGPTDTEVRPNGLVRMSGPLTNANYSGADCTTSAGREINNIASLWQAMRDGVIYLNIHTLTNAGGELRAQMN